MSSPFRAAWTGPEQNRSRPRLEEASTRSAREELRAALGHDPPKPRIVLDCTFDRAQRLGCACKDVAARRQSNVAIEWLFDGIAERQLVFGCTDAETEPVEAAACAIVDHFQKQRETRTHARVLA